jgi:hypothetical protein
MALAGRQPPPPPPQVVPPPPPPLLLPSLLASLIQPRPPPPSPFYSDPPARSISDVPSFAGSSRINHNSGSGSGSDDNNNNHSSCDPIVKKLGQPNDRAMLSKYVVMCASIQSFDICFWSSLSFMSLLSFFLFPPLTNAFCFFCLITNQSIHVFLLVFFYTYKNRYQVCIRQQLELFTAVEMDVQTMVQGRKRTVRIDQVGLRCRHCQDLPSIVRARGAIYYPKQIAGTYGCFYLFCCCLLLLS